ncbi:hypothetical protein I2W78_18290 [Streptomyces spinoverrucosus]|uniref:hypothetical protein n=1 Tax=Streptomyces spinoverrucosus TaxID=284043 RepID=UPI0018C3C093|nr:hypothetical protein [Streptomyces spinoverrucosus]MBG0853745.1 hypothetical protein [Streptomyces spinoverrucosus]
MSRSGAVARRLRDDHQAAVDAAAGHHSRQPLLDGALAAGVLLSAIPSALLGTGFLDDAWPAGPPRLLPALAAPLLVTAFVADEHPTCQALRT